MCYPTTGTGGEISRSSPSLTVVVQTRSVTAIEPCTGPVPGPLFEACSRLRRTYGPAGRYVRVSMKLFTLTMLALVLVFVLSQLWAYGQVRQIEMYPYSVVRTYTDIEVRRYAAANFIYVTMERGTYRESSSRGFRTLAGYIFGDNASGQKIAMTSPVEMEMSGPVTMKFMLPAEHDPSDLPRPNNAEVKFTTEAERTLAVISFSGFASDERILEYKERLFAALQREGIRHTGQWSFLGYDPPYRLVGRRNEVVVELLP